MAGIRSSLRVFLLPDPTIQSMIIFAVHLYRKTEITGAPIDKTAILIPCYNEEKTIDKVVGDRKRTLPEAEEEYEEHEELLAKVMRVIENMPVQTATVFRKCFLEKKKYQEAGDELNISINTVRWHITKAMKLLRESLSGEEMVLLYVLFVKK